MPNEVTSDGSDLKDDIHGTAAQNRIFKFETKTKDDVVILKIYDENGVIMYSESSDPFTAVGPHFFYIQVIGSDRANAGTDTMGENGLSGTYTWTVYSQNDGMLMQGVMDIAAES